MIGVEAVMSESSYFLLAKYTNVQFKSPIGEELQLGTEDP